jgi:hypothetical protein
MTTPFLHHYCSFMDSPAETVATARIRYDHALYVKLY